MFSQTERDLKEIAFKFFDTNGDGRLSERDMFELMQQHDPNFNKTSDKYGEKAAKNKEKIKED
jgi:Ca2+-binding EF-hand superfamily protein